LVQENVVIRSVDFAYQKDSINIFLDAASLNRHIPSGNPLGTRTMMHDRILNTPVWSDGFDPLVFIRVGTFAFSGQAG
jgi:hypothetical protein